MTYECTVLRPGLVIMGKDESAIVKMPGTLMPGHYYTWADQTKAHVPQYPQSTQFISQVHYYQIGCGKPICNTLYNSTGGKHNKNQSYYQLFTRFLSPFTNFAVIENHNCAFHSVFPPLFIKIRLQFSGLIITVAKAKALGTTKIKLINTDLLQLG